MRRTILKSKIAIFAFMIAVGGTAGANAEGTLILSLPGMPTGYTITNAAGLSDNLSSSVMYEGLTRWEKNKLVVKPSLATSWESNADATEWIFNLRENVKWHDGHPFTAEDVKFTFDTIMNKEVRAGARGRFLALSTVEVVSPTKVRMTFTQPFAVLPQVLAYVMPIAPKHLLEGQDLNQPQAFIEHPIGTGAFRFVEAASGQHWTVERNPEWWGGHVDLDEIVFKVVPNANSVVAQLKAGTVDVSSVQPQQIATLEASPDIRIRAVSQPSVYYVSLYNKKAPFDDVRIRRALNYAVDRAGIIKAVVNGYATPATGLIAPSVDGYTDDVHQYTYDPQKAKELLAEAGWVENEGKLTKDGQVMSIELTTSGGVIGGPQIAQIIQQQLGDIGIETTINMVDFRQLWTGVFDGAYQASVEYIAMPPDSDITNQLACAGSQNRFAYCDHKVDELLRTASGLTDEAQRNAKYAELQKFVAENPPGIFLYFPKEILAVNRRVEEFPENPIRMANSHLFDVKVAE